MPAVKYLHQDSDSNSKAEYIMGHSLQAVTMLVRAGVNYFAVPLACRIHEGLTVKEKEKRTLLDKIFELIISLKIDSPLYIVADAYYAAAKFAEHLIQSDQHLVTRVKTNAVAYAPVTQQMGKNQRGRPKKYGDKIKVYSVFECLDQFTEAESSLYGETNVSILYHTKTLYWRRFGKLVRYVWAIHPKRGKIVLISTDLALTPLQIIKLYGLRFKIEVSFKQSVHTLGTYSYHFWLKSMKAIKRRTGNQDLNELSDHQQKKVLKKMKAYHVHIQIGLIAQGLLQYLSIIESKLVWKTFGSWIRTMRPEMAPSEGVAAAALKNSLPEFLSSCIKPSIFKKFIRKKIDFSRAEGMRFSY